MTRKKETKQTKETSNLLFICDPELNTECKKTRCFHNPDSLDPVCKYTGNIAYAKKPITTVVTRLELDEEDTKLLNATHALERSELN